MSTLNDRLTVIAAARTKACEVCGETFTKPSHQSYACFADRRYCSLQCAGEAHHRGVSQEPTTCTCDTPQPDGLGECAGWHEGRPDTGERVA